MKKQYLFIKIKPNATKKENKNKAKSKKSINKQK